MTIKTVVTYFCKMSEYRDFQADIRAASALLAGNGKTDGVPSTDVILETVDPTVDYAIDGHKVERQWNTMEAAEEWVDTWTAIRDKHVALKQTRDPVPVTAIENSYIEIVTS